MKVKIVKGNFGKCYIMDCIKGMKTLKDKSIDLCCTDIPYGIDFKNNSTLNPKISYDDSELNMDWFEIAKRKCKRILFFGGQQNIGYLLNNFPLELGIWNNPIKQGRAKNTKAGGNKIEPYFTWNIDTLPSNIVKLIPVDRPLGFLNGSNLIITVHPSPKDSVIIDWIIKNLKPTSVLDCYLGSGTTSEICEKYGISWIGYEIKPEYIVDIRKRINRGIRQYKVKNPKNLMEI